MRYYTKQHKYYCGIDLHSKVMYVCVVDVGGAVLEHRNIGSNPKEFLEIITPYREDVVVAVECMFCWYWIADLCAEEGISFVLGHAQYMKVIHGGKAKNDKIDSLKIAMLARSGMFPESYVYPREMRGVRDLMRRRSFFVQRRSELYAHVQMTYQQFNFSPPGTKIAYLKNREALEKPFKDAATVFAVEADLEMIEHYSTLIQRLERRIEKLSRQWSANQLALSLLQTIPGIGPILSATILYEVHDIRRFPTVQHFASYARLVKPEKTSAGKKTGSGGAKIGNAHLRWAFGEAVMLFMRDQQKGKAYIKQLQKKHSKSKAMTILAHRLGRAAYFMLLRSTPWDEAQFFAQVA